MAMLDIVRVQYNDGDAGLIYATSVDLPGLLAAAPDMDSLREEIPRVIKALFKAQGVDVEVRPGRAPLGERGAGEPWVAIPTHVAAAAIGAD